MFLEKLTALVSPLFTGFCHPKTSYDAFLNPASSSSYYPISLFLFKTNSFQISLRSHPPFMISLEPTPIRLSTPTIRLSWTKSPVNSTVLGSHLINIIWLSSSLTLPWNTSLLALSFQHFFTTLWSFCLLFSVPSWSLHNVPQAQSLMFLFIFLFFLSSVILWWISYNLWTLNIA